MALYVTPADLDAIRRGDSDDVNVRELGELGFLANSPAPAETVATTRRLSAGIVWSSAHDFVQRSHDAGLRHTFDPGWILAQVMVAVGGAVTLAHLAGSRSLQLHARPGQIPAIIVLGLVAVSIHELGHALVTVHHGRRVRAAGLRLHLGSPTFYVDSVDALLLTRRQRIVQAAAGPWAEWLATSMASFVLLAVPIESTVGYVLHRFVIVNTIGIAMNLLPFVGLDGSLLLGDIIREPDLLARKRTALLAPRSLGRGDRWIFVYACTDSVVAALLLATAVFFWWQLFGGLIEPIGGFAPKGVMLALAAAAVLGGYVSRIFRPTVNRIRRKAVHWMAMLEFRLQRRWRVRAVTAFTVVPGIAQLDAEQLGILAGHLRRVRSADKEPIAGAGFVFLERLRIVVATVDTPISLANQKTALVLLPTEWRELVAP